MLQMQIGQRIMYVHAHKKVHKKPKKTVPDWDCTVYQVSRCTGAETKIGIKRWGDY
jgi:hypothetical protein